MCQVGGDSEHPAGGATPVFWRSPAEGPGIGEDRTPPETRRSGSVSCMGAYLGWGKMTRVPVESRFPASGCSGHGVSVNACPGPEQVRRGIVQSDSKKRVGREIIRKLRHAQPAQDNGNEVSRAVRLLVLTAWARYLLSSSLNESSNPAGRTSRSDLTEYFLVISPYTRLIDG